MKKCLFFAALLIVSSVNAQFTDDIETYPLGPVHTGHWDSWGSGTGAVDAIVTDIRSASGTKSILIKEGQAQDAILVFGNKTAGVWSASWKMYIPTDSTAYYNFQELTPVTTGEFAIQISFNVDGAAPGTATTMDDGGVVGPTFTYPQEEWFDIDHIIDLDNDMIIIKVNGTEVYNGAYYGGGLLGGVDFFSVDDDNRYYLDDISFIEGALSVQETTDIVLSVYPNPVSDFVNIKSDELITSVQIFDVMGKLVKEEKDANMALIINVSDLPNGTYFVKVFAGDIVKTVKVVK